LKGDGVRILKSNTRGLAILALLASGIVGCSRGPNVGEVTGKVTYQGKPVPFAAVEFKPMGEGKSSLGWTDEHGEYTAMYTLSTEGALVGKHKVSLRTYAEEGQSAAPVPAEFSGGDGKEFEVQPGPNRLDIAF
jgi:hypothetical protein